jgi:anion-transporting  ArsA/GET3 family ATPase
VFLSPGGLAARVFGRSSALVFAIFARVTGVDMLADLSRFFRSLAGVIDAFGARTRAVASLLRDPSTTFLIVTSPEHAPAREARFLVRSLTERGMSRGGLIVNRVHHLDGAEAHSPAAVQALLTERLGTTLAARAALNLAQFEGLAHRERAAIARLSAELEEPEPVLVPDLDEDVHDLAGLAQVAEHLFS